MSLHWLSVPTHFLFMTVPFSDSLQSHGCSITRLPIIRELRFLFHLSFFLSFFFFKLCYVMLSVTDFQASKNPDTCWFPTHIRHKYLHLHKSQVSWQYLRSTKYAVQFHLPASQCYLVLSRNILLYGFMPVLWCRHTSWYYTQPYTVANLVLISGIRINSLTL